MEKNQFSRGYNSKIFLNCKKNCIEFNIKTKKYFWDSSSFRPDPKSKMKNMKKYEGKVYLGKINIDNKNVVTIPKKIIIGNLNLINIRF